MKQLFIALIRLYQMTLSGVLGSQCRFCPSCSQYCIEALQKHGSLFGLWLGMKRISRCHPWHPGGYDPVPDPEAEQPTVKKDNGKT